jgi:polyprenyldihydroxybenzoate methyltransferase / 3-demethylubiquinol 3-O-methyltransferase
MCWMLAAVAVCSPRWASESSIFHSITDSMQRLARAGANATGIDASESNVSIASIHAAKDPQLSGINARWGSLKYIHTTAEALVKEQKRFDVVCSMEVIEHVDNPADFLRVCADLVKVCLLSSC